MDYLERVIGLDPGIDNLGISICDLNHSTQKLHVLLAYTIHPNDLCKHYSGMEWQSVRDYKLAIIRHEILRVYETYGFSKVIAESNYLGASAQAFKSLTECVSSIKQAVSNIDPTISIHLYEPSMIKTTMGVGGTDGDKDLMRNSLFNNKSILYSDYVNLNMLDEHSIDSICIAYHHLAGSYSVG